MSKVASALEDTRVSRVEAHVKCINCGYDLFLHDASLNCSECGHPIRNSVNPARIIFAPRNLRIALSHLFFAWFAALLILPVVLLFSFFNRPVNSVLNDIGILIPLLVLMCFAAWRLRNPIESRNRRLTRGLIVALAISLTSQSMTALSKISRLSWEVHVFQYRATMVVSVAACLFVVVGAGIQLRDTLAGIPAKAAAQSVTLLMVLWSFWILGMQLEFTPLGQYLGGVLIIWLACNWLIAIVLSGWWCILGIRLREL